MHVLSGMITVGPKSVNFIGSTSMTAFQFFLELPARNGSGLEKLPLDGLHDVDAVEQALLLLDVRDVGALHVVHRLIHYLNLEKK